MFYKRVASVFISNSLPDISYCTSSVTKGTKSSAGSRSSLIYIQVSSNCSRFCTKYFRIHLEMCGTLQNIMEKFQKHCKTFCTRCRGIVEKSLDCIQLDYSYELNFLQKTTSETNVMPLYEMADVQLPQSRTAREGRASRRTIKQRLTKNSTRTHQSH